MHRTIAILIALAVLTGCAHSDPWTKADRNRQISATAIAAWDMYQTEGIQYREDLREDGIVAKHVLGTQPTTRGVILTGITFGISYYLIARALPAKYRPYYQGVLIIGHGKAVIGNCRHDLRC